MRSTRRAFSCLNRTHERPVLAEKPRVDIAGVSVLVPRMQNQDEENELAAEDVEVVDGAVTDDSVESAESAAEPLTPEAEIAKWKEAAIRVAADLENYRKRMARERAEDLRFAKSGLLEELLPVVDNFAMGLQMAEKEQDSMIYKGMAMVKGQLDDFLASQGVKEVAAEGIFDPNFHEAVAEEEKEGAEEGEILSVKRKGYLLHDRLLRAAAVVVAKGPSGVAEAGKENEGGSE